MRTLDGAARTVLLPGPGVTPADAQRLHEEAHRAFAEGIRLLRLEFQRVQDFDAGGVRCLVRLMRQAPEAARVVLMGLDPRARRIVEATRLDAILEVQEPSGEAMRRRAG